MCVSAGKIYICTPVASATCPFEGVVVDALFTAVPVVCGILCSCFVCLIWFFTSHQQSFSYKGMGLPVLNQY